MEVEVSVQQPEVGRASRWGGWKPARQTVAQAASTALANVCAEAMDGLQAFPTNRAASRPTLLTSSPVALPQQHLPP